MEDLGGFWEMLSLGREQLVKISGKTFEISAPPKGELWGWGGEESARTGGEGYLV